MSESPVKRAWRNTSKRKKKRFREACEKELQPCCICGEAIDYKAEPQTPLALTIEHEKPKHAYPELIGDMNNWKPAHHECNQEDGRKYNMKPGGMTYRPFEGQQIGSKVMSSTTGGN